MAAAVDEMAALSVSGGAAEEDEGGADYSATDSEEDEAGEMEEFVPRARPTTRKVSVMSAAIVVEEDWQPPVFEKSEEQKALLDSRVKGIFFMAHLTQQDVDTLVMAFELKQYAVDDILMTQGEEGDCFYVIESGKTDVIVDIEGNPTKVAEKDGDGPNNFVGELALLYNAPRSATIKATTELLTWSLDRTTFKTIMEKSAKGTNDKHHAFLDKVPILDGLSPTEKMQLADALKTKTYMPGELIIKEGDEGRHFFIVEEGEVVATKLKEGVEVEVSDNLGPGSFFGELALLNDDTRKASVKAVGSVVCLYIDRATFKRVMGPLEEIMKDTKYTDKA